jgi:glutathione S-transferase
MLKIWGRATSSNVQKAMWAVGELAIPHERVDVGGKFGGLETPAYRAMNPNALVPTLQDGDLTVWESHAIVRYLAAQYGQGRLWPADAKARARSDKWMDWVPNTLGADSWTVFGGLIRTAPSKQNKPAIADGAKRLGEKYATADRELASKPFISGDSLTIGDIPLGTSLYRYFTLPIARPSLPNLEAYYARLAARPAYATHVMVSYDELRVSD